MEEIIKVAENNVEVRVPRQEYDVESYGQDRLDDEMKSINDEIFRIENYDKNKELEEANKKLDRLKSIEAEMKK